MMLFSAFSAIALLWLVWTCVFRAFADLTAILTPMTTWKENDGVGQMMRKSALRAFVAGSVARARSLALIDQSYRLGSWRFNWMVAAFSPLAAALALGAMSYFLQVSGLWISGLGAILLILGAIGGGEKRPLFDLARKAGWFFFWAGLFYLLNENLTRFWPMWLNNPDTENTVFFLSDGRWAAVLALTVLVSILTALVPLPGFALLVILVGSTAGILSINGAAAVWIGESIGTALRAFWFGRKSHQGPRELSRDLLAVTIAAGLLFVPLGFVARDFAGNVTGTSALNQLLPVVLTMIFFFEAISLVLLSGAGHFRAKTLPQDVLESDLWAWSEIRRAPRADLKAWVALVEERLQKMNSVRGAFNQQEWERVPPAVRNASQKEAELLEKRLDEMKALLLSRSEFLA